MTLEASRLFSQLAPRDLEALRRLAREQAFAAGQEVFKEGDAGDGLYVVRSGLVDISVLVEQHGRHVLTRIGPGDLFGEMAVVEDKPRSACAVAAGDTTVYFFPRAELLALVGQCPALALALLREISGRLREFDRQYLREVVQAERLAVVGRFAGAIMHDMKNPLNLIGLAAEVAGLEKTTPEARGRAVGDVRRQAERIHEMVGEILDFTQGVSPDLVLAPTEYGAFVGPIIEELRSEAALKRMAVELENSPPAVPVRFNPRRLRRVFYNLFYNATDAMAAGGRILLRFRVTETEVVTELEDTGPGIAPEIADRLFEAFVTYGKTHGTGLGLTICKRIVEDHGGWIAARNGAGAGAVFSFGLPLARP